MKDNSTTKSIPDEDEESHWCCDTQEEPESNEDNIENLEQIKISIVNPVFQEIPKDKDRNQSGRESIENENNLEDLEEQEMINDKIPLIPKFIQHEEVTDRFKLNEYIHKFIISRKGKRNITRVSKYQGEC